MLLLMFFFKSVSFMLTSIVRNFPIRFVWLLRLLRETPYLPSGKQLLNSLPMGKLVFL
jgi:hypothetical protein